MSRALWRMFIRVSLALALLLVFPGWFGAQDRITYSYDQQGRLTELKGFGASVVTYEYDQSGRLVSVTQHAPVPQAGR